jgi:hypothetical protein
MERDRRASVSGHFRLPTHETHFDLKIRPVCATVLLASSVVAGPLAMTVKTASASVVIHPPEACIPCLREIAILGVLA